jgi:hypothetical protein
MQALGERALPTLSSRKKACISLLTRHNCTLGDVISIIVVDPGLTVAVLQNVNRRRGKKRVRIASVESAANLIGQTQLKACIEEVPELETVCRAEDLPITLMLWERQRHAAAQAAHWALLREDKSPSECAIVAMCAGLPELMICVYHPHEYRAVLAAQDALGSQGAGATRGVDFAGLGRQLVQRWCLPELLGDVFRADRYEFYRPLGIMLASELARLVDSGWYTAGTVTCLEVVAEYLGWPYDRCVEMVHQVAVRTARSGTLPGVVAAAARLVHQPGEVAISGIPAGKREEPVTTETDDRQTRLQGILLQFKQRLRGADLRTVLSLTISVLHKRLGFSRCAFFILNKEKSSLQARIALGEGAAALQQLQLDAETSPVFVTLFKKPQSLLVNAQNRQRYAPYLPAGFETLGTSDFACMSLFAGQRPIGVVYVDRQSGKSFGADRYACFKKICGLANQSMRASAAKAKTAGTSASRVA